MEQILCPLCEFLQIKNKKVIEQISNYSIIECSNCYVHFSNPFEHARIETYDQSWKRKKRARSFEREIKRILTSPRYRLFFEKVKIAYGSTILDVGCGSGAFLKILGNQGHKVYGVEQSPEALVNEEDYTQFGKIYHGSVFDLPDEFKSFDVITAFEVLEHLDNPNRFIHLMYDKLQKGGFFYVSVPDSERLEIRLAGGRSRSDYPPIHLTRWSYKSLDNFLSQWKWEEKSVFHTALETTPLFNAIRQRLIKVLVHSNDLLSLKTRNIYLPPSEVKDERMHTTADKQTFMFKRALRLRLDGLLWHLFPVTQRLGLYGHSLVALCKKP
jgi:SAM-dependent methyltransferase